ncbi:MAG: sulfite exporter TauE/SafE family protein, partial [Nitrospinae bacterium]|nr:sulfite exporter TauE/SafE family protein [Nitrospinota bacterium]
MQGRSVARGWQDMTAEHWFLLPVGSGIAILAMSSGISAGNLWVPVYLLWTRFEAPLAFWMTLVTMLFGYGSGVARNLQQGTINRGFLAQYLPFTVPAAMLGGLLSPSVDVSWLILLFGAFVLGYGVWMLVPAIRSARHVSPLTPTATDGSGGQAGRGAPWGIAILGGAFLGLIAVGLGEIMLPRMLNDRKLSHPAEAVGSAVLIIFVTSVAAAMVRLNTQFVTALVEQRTVLLNAMLFAAPGVVLGGQLGPRIAQRLNARTLRLYVASLLLVVGILMLVRFCVMVGFIR